LANNGAFVLDLKMRSGKFLPLREPVSEENYEYEVVPAGNA
jgi:hypothetical protein